jgi:hypothetical protein
VDHHVRKVFIFKFLTFSLMGDGPILAEDTAEITIGKENGTRSIFAYQRYLFAKMGLSAENHWSVWGSAEPSFAFWQKIQRRLQLEKKMVPDPFLPTNGTSSPKWG